MASKSFNYDHAAYLARFAVSETGPNTANTSFPGINAAFPSLALSATFTAIVAGTSAAGNLWVINKISGITTTALATATLGITAAGGVINIPLTTAAGGVALATGDQLVAVKGTDTVSTNLLAYEFALQPLANVTA
jgi:hypothetical protein